METTMNFFHTATAAFVVAASLATAGSANAFERWVNVYNTSDLMVTAIQISNIRTDVWGPNILYGVIPAGDVSTVDPVNTEGYCRFDIRLSYEDGSTASIYDVNLCEALDLVTDGWTYEVYTI
jgi:hypothetical protein